MTTISDMQTLTNQYQNIVNTLTFIKQTIVIAQSQGQALYANPNLPTLYPNSYAAFQSFLLTVQTAVQTCLQSIPAIPPLNG